MSSSFWDDWWASRPFTKHRLGELASLAGPTTLSFYADMVLPLSTTFFLGHLDNAEYLGASVLGNMWANAFGLSVIIGLAMGMESLAPQAFGSEERKLVGLYCQRALVITSLACIPVAIAWLLAGYGLSFIFRVDASVAELAQQWVSYRLPGLWPTAAIECLRRFIQAQNLAWPNTVTTVVVSIVHLVITWFLVDRFGYLGAAASISISQWLMLIVLLAIVITRDLVPSASPKVRDCWPSLQMTAIFSGWRQYLRFSLPAAASLFIEWGGYEVYAAIVAQLGTTALAAQSILNATAIIWYMVPLGISIAGATLTGIALGRRDAHDAQSFVVLTTIVVMCWAVINITAAVFYRSAWVRLFTDNQEVIDLTLQMFSVLWIYYIFDCLKCLGMSILRGTHRQNFTVVGNLISQLLVGYPVAFICSRIWGLYGVWVGLTATWSSCALLYCVAIYRTDWQDQLTMAAEEVRIGKRGALVDHSEVALLEGKEEIDDEEPIEENDEAIQDQSITYRDQADSDEEVV